MSEPELSALPLWPRATLDAVVMHTATEISIADLVHGFLCPHFGPRCLQLAGRPVPGEGSQSMSMSEPDGDERGGDDQHGDADHRGTGPDERDPEGGTGNGCPAKLIRIVRSRWASHRVAPRSGWPDVGSSRGRAG